MRGGVLRLVQNDKLIQTAVYDSPQGARIIMAMWEKLNTGMVEVRVYPNQVDDNGIEIEPLIEEKKTVKIPLWEREKKICRTEKPIPKIKKEDRPPAQYNNIATPYGIATKLHNGQ